MLEKLPTEELSAVLRQLVSKAHLIETISACKDILQAFVEEVQDEVCSYFPVNFP